MSLHLKAAHVIVCANCGNHAHILTADGAQSPEFGTKKVGKAIVADLLEAGNIDQHERLHLLDSIEHLNMPYNDYAREFRFTVLNAMHEVMPDGDSNETTFGTMPDVPGRTIH